MSGTFKIGTVAKRTGLSIDAIRFYEKEGLLKTPLRSEGGFRLFQEKDIEDLHLIRNRQTLGFSLDEIRDLLSLRSRISTPCAEVQKLLERKLIAVQRKIAELNRWKPKSRLPC
jgi:DNA-binding transcriptional MerR regulator